LLVARKHGERHTTLVTPRRTIDDLVLPPELHARVVDIVHYFRALPTVMDEWGFARRVSGGGLKALFTGEPGTGKTLAAEAVAHELGLPMLRVDLARVVSKWIGETEKNLDLVFNEARDSHAVLFFDEAEALFGARGDVRHGTDRYANLEVSYLLQRFEDHGGVVILATNLRDKIDHAFMRRFQVVVGFPRPSEKERRRLWQRVFTPATPLAGDLDVPTLARLDLTGAGIVGAAQVAAMCAEREGASVAMKHVVRGLVRQYQRESRVLTGHDLGAHAIHMAP
jgi:SpoVK/Ycf46/Vps4 family AAA+-type ATPase